MTEIDIEIVLRNARPIALTDNEIVLVAHAKAVKKAESLIKCLKDPYLMSLLIDRYIEGMTYKEIAINRGIGVSTAYRFHNIAIERIKNAKGNTKQS